MGLQILSIAYGKKHVELFKKACIKSLSFRENARAIAEAKATWNIFTEPEYFEDIKCAILKEIYLDADSVVLRSMDLLRRYTDPLQSAFVWQIEECLKQNDKCMYAPPDILFGDGSIKNILKLGKDRFTCVASAHPRVLPDILSAIDTGYPINNSNMVMWSWRHLHKSWGDGEKGHPNQNSFIGGVEWQEIDENLYSVVHRLPTVYLADFTDEDLQYFKLQLSFGAYDHNWPGDVLIPRGRFRYASSSDAFFACEITEKDKNVPPYDPKNPKNGFWRQKLHHDVLGQMQVIFRGS